MKTVHILLLLLLIVGAFVLLDGLFAESPEGFQDLEERRSVMDFLTNFFHYRQAAASPVPAGATIAEGSRYTKQIPVDPGFTNLAAIDEATATLGDVKTNKDAQFSKFFYPSITRYLSLDDACRQAVGPRNLTGRAPDADYGCGWWYVSDPMVPSTGAYGTYKSPHYADRLAKENPGGTWIWDLREAEQKEDVKRCKRIRSCEYINADAVAGKCAFCPELGYAVPVTDTGALKYPTNSEAVCGDTGSLILNADACPLPKYVPKLASNDYEYDVNGNVIEGPNTDARRLYEAGALDLGAECTPYEGRLSVSCLVNLARSAGFSPEGAMMRLIKTGGPLQAADRVGFEMLETKASIVVGEALWKTRTMSRDEAATLFGKIATAAIAKSEARDAARWFTEGRSFDACAYADNDVGPFPLECVRQEFRKAGCQASGTAYPNKGVGGTMGEIRGRFRDLYATMNRDPARSIKEQDEAVAACLGVQQVRSESATWTRTANTCNDKGVEYFVMDGSVLVGRFISQRGFISDVGAATPDALYPLLLRVQKGPATWRARTVLRGASTATDTRTLRISNIPAGATYVVRADGDILRAGSDGVWTITVPPRSVVVLEVLFSTPVVPEGPYRPAWGTLTTDIPTDKLLLLQSRWKPYISIDASTEGRLVDGAGLVAIPTATATATTTATGNINRKGQSFSQNEVAVPLTLRSDMVTTLTVMMAWSTLQSSATVVRFEGATQAEVIALTIQNRVPTLLYATAKVAYSLPYTTSLRDFDADTWIHLAAVISPDPTRTRLYMNGADVTGKPVTLTGFVADTTPFVIQKMVLGSAGFRGGLAWVHVYAGPLQPNAVARDVNYDDPKYHDDDEEVKAASGGVLSEMFGFQILGGKKVGGTAVPLETVQASSQEACASLAAARADCSVFEYNAATKQCRLFKELKDADIVSNTDFVVGRKPYRSRVGYEWKGRPLAKINNVRTPQQCAKACSDAREARSGSNPVCGGFTHTSSTGTCRLFRSLHNQTESSQVLNDVVSGRMSYNTDDYNVALQRGAIGVSETERCAVGFHEYGVKPDRVGKCCPVLPTNPDDRDYQSCSIPFESIGKEACSLNPRDKFVTPCFS